MSEASPSPGTEGAQRAVPYLCPFCGEEDLRPEPQGRWHCRSCLRLFSVQFFGLLRPEPSTPGNGAHTPSVTPPPRDTP